MKLSQCSNKSTSSDLPIVKVEVPKILHDTIIDTLTLTKTKIRHRTTKEYVPTFITDDSTYYYNDSIRQENVFVKYSMGVKENRLVDKSFDIDIIDSTREKITTRIKEIPIEVTRLLKPDISERNLNLSAGIDVLSSPDLIPSLSIKIKKNEVSFGYSPFTETYKFGYKRSLFKNIKKNKRRKVLSPGSSDLVPDFTLRHKAF